MSTETIRAILFDIAPELTTEDEAAIARVDRFIGYAVDEINRDAYKKPDMATALLAAHKLTVAGRGGANQGAVTKERVGDLERGYAAPTGSKTSPYSSTSYGVEFEALGQKSSKRRVTPFAL